MARRRARSAEASVARASAVANSITLPNRSPAFTAIARCSAWSTSGGTSGRFARELGGAAVKRFAISAAVVAPVQGGSPASIS